MAVRLTVIMIESPPPTAAAGRLAEDIVGNLIGRPGIDMTLVRSLNNLQESSTDRLTLDGITSDVAVLDWQSPQAMVDSLNAMGFSGQRSPHSLDLDSKPASNPGRRIYAFDLTKVTDVNELTVALNALKSERTSQNLFDRNGHPQSEPQPANHDPTSSGRPPAVPFASRSLAGVQTISGRSEGERAKLGRYRSG